MNKVKFLMSFALLAVFVGVGLRLIFDYEHIPNLVPVESVRDKYFDYIIIGGGTAGSVLSYELSKHSNYSVLLIEAGGVFNGLSIIPLTTTLMQGTEMDWRLKSIPQSFSSRGLRDRRQAIPRGKGLGGSHQINYLLHFDGVKENFDGWQKLGAHEWSYDNLQTLLTRHETCRDECPSPKLSITQVMREDSGLAAAFTDARNEMQKAFHPNVTLNLAKFTTRRGIRHSVFHEYLRRAYKHKNLSIMVHAKVEKIVFNEKKEAVAVIVGTKSQSARVFARREIILSAGAVHSPHILQLSGVGDEGELKSVGINLQHHSSGVGGNLFDHMNFPLFVSINETASVTKNKILSTGEIYRYLIDGKGALSTTAVVGTGRLSDHGIILFGMGSTDESMLKHLANFETDTFRAFFPLHANSSQEGFVSLSTCLLPKSRGTVRINPDDAAGDPLINPNYLNETYDMSCMRNAVRMTMALVATKAFRKLDAKIHWPVLSECRNFGPFEETSGNLDPSDRYLDCLIRHAALTAHHPGGTCAIGSVVDNNLRVIGVRNLRVVDGSIFPAPVSGVPNSVIIAVAERASQLILSSDSR